KKNVSETVLTSNEYEVLTSLNCDRAIYAIYADGPQKGQKQLICKKSTKCPVHHRQYVSSLPKEEKTEEVLAIESKERRDRKEEIIDVNVGEIVRRMVLAEAAKKFDAEHTIFNHPEKADDYLYQLTNLLWKFQCYFSTDNAVIICRAMGLKKIGQNSYTDDDPIKNLTADERSRLLWLIIHTPKARLYENGNWKSQAEIKQIAEDFEVDYRQIDAFQRLLYAQDKHEKHAKEFHNYLVKVEAGDAGVEIPRVYSPDYKPKESK
ncbi:MAG: hypothetical protein KGZ58_13750, partial [Ignavibacteriales bacterium]|nr:hypothetical protein [Ignavibacteriales bacterium]